MPSMTKDAVISPNLSTFRPIYSLDPKLSERSVSALRTSVSDHIVGAFDRRQASIQMHRDGIVLLLNETPSNAVQKLVHEGKATAESPAEA